MAELVVGALTDAVVGELIEKLGCLEYKEFASVWGVADNVEKLSSILSTIQAIFQDAEEKQIADKSIADWLSKLKATAYDADDVLDEWLTDAQGHPTGSSSSHHQLGISDAFSYLNLSQTSFRLKIAKKIRKIIIKFDGIAEERSRFHLNSVVVQHQTGFQVDETRETSPLLTEEVIYGRDGDREEIVDLLLNNVTLEQAVSTLSILGIGGLGKTTLAQLVYNDQRVVDNFDARIWVCVSDNFELKRLIKLILESLTGNSCNLDSLDAIQQHLQENLRGKKFLLVLDDVWNEDQKKWCQLKSSITCGASGSSIIVTTRLETVTKVVSTLPPHKLSFLSEEECFSLLKRRAFGEGNEESAKLAVIGKEIVKKCGGIPLAAKALGGLLFCSREVNEEECPL